MIALLIINPVIDCLASPSHWVCYYLPLQKNVVNNNNDDNIKPFLKDFITADKNQIHVWNNCRLVIFAVELNRKN